MDQLAEVVDLNKIEQDQRLRSIQLKREYKAKVLVGIGISAIIMLILIICLRKKIMETVMKALKLMQNLVDALKVANTSIEEVKIDRDSIKKEHEKLKVEHDALVLERNNLRSQVDAANSAAQAVVDALSPKEHVDVPKSEEELKSKDPTWNIAND